MISSYIDKIRRIARPDKDIMDKILFVNIQRAFYLALISIPTRVVMIYTFFKMPVYSKIEESWRRGIIASHFIYFFFMFILCILLFKLRRSQANRLMIICQYVMILTILFSSTALALIDQLATTNIVPYLTACMAVGAIFITKPFHSIFIFLSNFIIFYLVMGMVQLELSVLVSNGINGLSSALLVIFLSFLMWKYNVVNFQQQKQIRSQQKMLEDSNREL